MLSVFEYTDESDDYRYQLYIPTEHARKYNMIVNLCKTEKRNEFDFERIDYKKLLK